MSIENAKTTVQEVKQLADGTKVYVSKTVFINTWLIRINGQWTIDGLLVTHVVPGGPATKMWSELLGITDASLEPGDRVVSINDLAILNDKDWALALRDAPDHNKVKLTVVNVQDGSVYDWFVKPQQRPGGVVIPQPPPPTQPPTQPPPTQPPPTQPPAEEEESGIDFEEKELLNGIKIPVKFDGYLNHTDCQTIVMTGDTAGTTPMPPWVAILILAVKSQIQAKDQGKGVHIKGTATGVTTITTHQ